MLKPFVRYRRMDPMKFKTGDLVEAQVYFVGVPLKGGGTKMMMVLRALTLLDCQQSMVIINSKLRIQTLTHSYLHKQDVQREKTKPAFMPSSHVGTPLKHKVGSGSTAVIETRHKFQAMSVDERNNCINISTINMFQ
ncbi:hypothetical protein PILCRDRAFT_75989 [Piloderma croceum F 1598]|uniref:Uncharacterized protein n=1 Tax=Piloderma croceum (strain F 1598) TaxID=765440 RepID=A0A0C3AVP5_PILCF|nr:hypothetical protein PILCRDRAFT_75989 [Piloderma croceum F 1598]